MYIGFLQHYLEESMRTDDTMLTVNFKIIRIIKFRNNMFEFSVKYIYIKMFILTSKSNKKRI